MKSPLVRRKTHERELDKLDLELAQTQEALARARNESATWQVEYRKIRGRIADIATHPQATPQIKATLAEFAGFKP